MWSRKIRRSAMLAVLVALAASLAAFSQDSSSSSHRGRKYKAPPPTSRVDVTILRADDGKPVENAAVIFQVEGDKGNMELKTNEDGKTMIDVLPTGSKVLVQVIARGYQTYGGDFKLDKSELPISIKLKRPGQQYSIYEQHPQSASAGSDPAKPGSSNPDKSSSANAASNSSSTESAQQSDPKPDQGQPQPQ